MSFASGVFRASSNQRGTGTQLPVPFLMPTYSTIREAVLLALDVHPSAPSTDHTVQLVNHTLKMVMDELVIAARPISMLAEATFTVDSSTTAIALGVGGFEVADLGEVLAVSVDEKGAAERDDYAWAEVSYPQWIANKRFGSASARRAGTWTRTPTDEFVLGVWPSATQEWDVYLHYYRAVAAITDDGTPELPEEHHLTTLLGGVVRYFPHRFQGDRAGSLALYVQSYTDGKAQLMRKRKSIGQQLRLRPIGDAAGTPIDIWPGFQTS